MRLKTGQFEEPYMASNSYVSFDGLPLADLLALRAQVLAGITQIMVTGQSYSLGGRSFTAANLSELRSMLGDIGIEIAKLSGRTSRRTLAVMR